MVSTDAPQNHSQAKLIKLAQVMLITGLSRSEIYLKIKQATFPKPIKKNAWLESEIYGWVKTQTNQSILNSINWGDLPRIIEAVINLWSVVNLLLQIIPDNPWKSTVAAKEHGCYLWIPDFTGFDVSEKSTDANDLHKLADLAHLKTVITQDLDSSYLKSPVTVVTTVTAYSGAGSSVTSEKNELVTAVTNDIRGGYPIPDMRPCFRVYEDFTKIGRNTTLKAGIS